MSNTIDPAGPNQATDNPILARPIRVINIGLSSFAEALSSQGVAVTHVHWQPPAGGNERLAALLGKLGL